jgi:hypothetical protein
VSGFSVRRRFGAATVALAISVLGLAATPAAAAGTFNVKSFGATGNGSSNDSPAFDKAITAANSAGGGTVEVPAGTYKAGSTIHLKSNVTIQLDSGSTVVGTSSGYDKPESNPNDRYQDYGHSHFHNAMFYGDRLTDIGFTGSGTVDGGGHFIHGDPDPGQADKLLSLTRCNGLTLNGVTFKRGGHFAILTNGCTNITSDHLTISTASDRDGWNVINAQHVHITNINDAANDDALVFKSDWALGTTLNNGDVTVSNANLSAGCCNALMFGSETCGNFTGYDFQHIHITTAGKSGLGIVSMDGANISNVHYNDVTMAGTQSPIMLKIGTRKRCGDSPGIGSISDIHFANVTGSAAGAYSPTIWGQPGHQIHNVTFDNVNLRLPGGKGAQNPYTLPSDSGDYNPKSLGTRPAYGWFLHEANDIHFTNSSVRLDKADARPAVVANGAANVTFDHFTAQVGSGQPFDMGFKNVAGYCVSNSTNTSGGALRIDAPGSTKSCPTGPSDFSLSVNPSVAFVRPGGSTTATVTTRVTSGSALPVTLSASQPQSGVTLSFNPKTVTAGSSSTLTVTASSSAQPARDPFPVTITGTSGSTTHTTSFGVVVSSGDQLLSQGKPVKASSEGGSGYVATNAVDGSTATRWASVSHVDPQWIRVDLGSARSMSRVSLVWDVSCATAYRIETSNDDSTWTSVYSTTTGDGGTDDIAVNASARYVRMFGTVRCRDAGYSLQEFQVFGSPSSDSLLSQGQPVKASSDGGSGYVATNAVDGSAATRWASVSKVDPQWIRVDLGTTRSLSKVSLVWDLSCATSYRIETSNDDTTWTSVYSTITGDGGTDEVAVSGSGRYVRMFGTARCRSTYGYSLQEFQVFGH